MNGEGLTHREGVCNDYGTCGEKNCAKQSPAKLLDDPTFYDYCPHLANKPVCCSSDQFNNLKTKLALAKSILQSCKACFRNFYTFWCEYTCSPNQSLFVKTSDVITSHINNASVTQVTGTYAYVSPEFGEKFFNSCKDVTFAGTGTKVSALSCEQIVVRSLLKMG